MKLFYSGGEQKVSFDLMVKAGCQNILMSWWYIRKKKDAVRELLRSKPEYMDVMIDSGAHTLQEIGAKSGYTKEMYETWIHDYLAFLDEHRQYVTLGVEMDIPTEIGLNVIHEWREKIFVPFMKDTGIPICLVNHEDGLAKKQDWFPEWDEMCSQSPVVGIAQSELNIARANRAFVYARKRGSKIHGFAMTKFEWMTRYPFYSVDSISWKSGSMWGVTYRLEGTRLRAYDSSKKDIRKRLKREVEALGISFADVLADKALAVDTMNLAQWVKYEKQVSERTKKKQYWLNPTTLVEVEDVEDVDKDVDNYDQEDCEEVGLVTPEIMAGDEVWETNLDEAKDVQVILEGEALGDFIANLPAFQYKISCEVCYMKDTCDFSSDEEGAKCRVIEAVRLRTPADYMAIMNKLTELQFERVQRAIMIERTDGGTIDRGTTDVMKDMITLLNAAKGFGASGDSIDIKAKGKPAGVLAQIFGIGK